MAYAGRTIRRDGNAAVGGGGIGGGRFRGQLGFGPRRFSGASHAQLTARAGRQAEGAVAAGLMPWQLWFDPGIGFAKTPADSLDLIRRLPEARAPLPAAPLRLQGGVKPMGEAPRAKLTSAVCPDAGTVGSRRPSEERTARYAGGALRVVLSSTSEALPE